jgi:glyoxylase-like metal-dependent hydrolase (beta-lactamase superfamily II)
MRLPVIALVLASACSSTGSKSPAVPAGRAQSFQVGNLEAFALADGHYTIANDGSVLGFGRPPSDTGDVLAAAGLSRETFRLDIQSLLVKAGDRVLLFDTGTGDPTYAEGGLLLVSLAVAKVRPIEVTDIFISHAHGDHIGGLVTKTGAATFPAATVHISAPEWALLQQSTEAKDKQIIAAVGAKVDAFEPGAQILPVVKAVATPGHTPGHSSYQIGAETEKLFYIGDVAHHSVVSVQRPAWSMQFDMDRPAAEAMRQQTLAKLAADHERVFAFHFPYPGIGHVVAEGQGLVWKAEVP